MVDNSDVSTDLGDLESILDSQRDADAYDDMDVEYEDEEEIDLYPLELMEI